MSDLLVRGIGRLLSMAGPVVGDAAVAVLAGRVRWIGRERDLPPDLGELAVLDAEGGCVLPGFVDPHTHLLVWAARGGRSCAPGSPAARTTAVASTARPR